MNVFEKTSEGSHRSVEFNGVLGTLKILYIQIHVADVAINYWKTKRLGCWEHQALSQGINHVCGVHPLWTLNIFIKLMPIHHVVTVMDQLRMLSVWPQNTRIGHGIRALYFLGQMVLRNTSVESLRGRRTMW